MFKAAAPGDRGGRIFRSAKYYPMEGLNETN
jgi:hypothetical protein